MAALNPGALATLRGTLLEHIDRGRIPGAVVLVARGGEIALFDALGVRDPGAGDAMATDTIFRIYSMTKPLVSLAALMLAEEGRLQLGDPVSRYLPVLAHPQVAVDEPAQPGSAPRLVPAHREPTVHDLLRHTAGYTYEFLGSSPVQQQYVAADLGDRSRSNAQFCAALAAIPLAHQPGSCWHYSRATDVLGALLEVVAGASLGQVLQQRILGPLGMKDTGFSVPEAQWSRVAEPFTRDPDTGATVELIDVRTTPNFESGGGGLLSTAGDYLRFLQMMRAGGRAGGDRLVSRKTIEWMTSDHLGTIPVLGELLAPGHGFGLGVAVRLETGLGPQPGSRGTYHWSGIGGTSFFVDPVEDVFAMLLTQAPNQRIFFRNLLRHGVYAAID